MPLLATFLLTPPWSRMQSQKSEAFSQVYFFSQRIPFCGKLFSVANWHRLLVKIMLVIAAGGLHPPRKERYFHQPLFPKWHRAAAAARFCANPFFVATRRFPDFAAVVFVAVRGWIAGAWAHGHGFWLPQSVSPSISWPIDVFVVDCDHILSHVLQVELLCILLQTEDHEPQHQEIDGGAQRCESQEKKYYWADHIAGLKLQEA